MNAGGQRRRLPEHTPRNRAAPGMSWQHHGRVRRRIPSRWKAAETTLNIVDRPAAAATDAGPRPDTQQGRSRRPGAGRGRQRAWRARELHPAQQTSAPGCTHPVQPLQQQHRKGTQPATSRMHPRRRWPSLAPTRMRARAEGAPPRAWSAPGGEARSCAHDRTAGHVLRGRGRGDGLRRGHGEGPRVLRGAGVLTHSTIPTAEGASGHSPRRGLRESCGRPPGGAAPLPSNGWEAPGGYVPPCRDIRLFLFRGGGAEP